MKKLFLLLVIGAVGYLNYTNPTRQDHENFLLAELEAQGPVTEEQFENILATIDYSNFMVCSATKTALDSKLISFGYYKKIKLVNDKWLNETVAKFRGKQGN